MDPKNPQPNHPFAHAAAEETDAITQMLSAPPTDQIISDPPAPALPDPVISAPIAPVPAPSAPARDEAYLQLQAALDTERGRLEKANRERNEAVEAAATHKANADFLAQRAQERADEIAQLVARKNELETVLEVNEATKGFTSDIVDQSQFAEILRGVLPLIKKSEEKAVQVAAQNVALTKRLDEMHGTLKAEVGKLDQKWLDRSLVRTSPELTTMLKSTEGKEYLAQVIPGTRRTRQDELADAYRDGDDLFITQFVADWKRMGKPQDVSNPEPNRTIVNESPRPPVPEVILTEDHVQAEMQRFRNQEITKDQLRKTLATYSQQTAAGKR
jgi:hypothetical protein